LGMTMGVSLRFGGLAGGRLLMLVAREASIFPS
jgi:hypothetical protein